MRGKLMALAFRTPSEATAHFIESDDDREEVAAWLGIDTADLSNVIDLKVDDPVTAGLGTGYLMIAKERAADERDRRAWNRRHRKAGLAEVAHRQPPSASPAPPTVS